MPKNEHGLQSVTTWVKNILGVRDLTSCHTPLSEQRANNIGIHTVHSATDSQHAVIVGVQKGAFLSGFDCLGRLQQRFLSVLQAKGDFNESFSVKECTNQQTF